MNRYGFQKLTCLGALVLMAVMFGRDASALKGADAPVYCFWTPRLAMRSSGIAVCSNSGGRIPMTRLASAPTVEKKRKKNK